MEKGKVKMLEYVDPDENKSTHSLDSEFEGLDVLIMQMNGLKKVIATANEKIRRSTREKNSVSRFGYDDYIAYHYSFMMKVATVRELENVSEAAKDP